MKTYFPIFVFMSFLCFPLFSQDNSLVTLSVQGEVLYFLNKKADPIPVYAGMTLNPGGKISIKKESNINLLIGQKSITLDQPGDHEIDQFFKKNISANSMSFDKSFWKLVNESMQSSNSKEELIAYAEKFEPEKQSGFANKTYDVNLETAFEGNIGGEDISFRWKAYSDKSTVYHFSIRHSTSEQLIFKALTYDTAFMVNFENLALIEGETYNWEIEVENEDKDPEAFFITRSPKIQFDYIPNSMELVQTRLKRIENYNKSDETKKEWMEAVALEEKGFYYQAYKRYQKLRKEHPDNVLIKKLYAAFLARRGFISEANEALRD